MDDHMLPNDGEYFMPTEPVERTRKRDSARSKTKAAEDFIIEEIQRFDKKIDYYNTFASIPDDVLADPDVLGFHIAANKQTVVNLQIEKEHFKALLKGI